MAINHEMQKLRNFVNYQHEKCKNKQNKRKEMKNKERKIETERNKETIEVLMVNISKYSRCSIS